MLKMTKNSSKDILGFKKVVNIFKRDKEYSKYYVNIEEAFEMLKNDEVNHITIKRCSKCNYLSCIEKENGKKVYLCCRESKVKVLKDNEGECAFLDV